MAGKPVAGDLYWKLDGQLWEIKRQLRQSGGYPFDPAALKRHLHTAIEGKFAVIGHESKQWSVWRTMRIGTPDLRTANDFRAALKAAGCKISGRASDMLNQPGFTAAAEESEIELVRLTVAELGFPKRATREDIYNRAKERGLDLCPAEVGPRLRLEYKDQPKGEWLRVAIDPIRVLGGDPDVWDVGHDADGLWILGDCGYPGNFWNASNQWVFVRRK